MSTETQLDIAKMPILMKGGLTHWVSEETWGRVSETLANQKQHSFMRISELGGIVINTAEIEGVYTVAQYDDLTKIKQGMWNCAYRTWHLRKGECECKGELMKKHREELARIREQAENKPLTDEQKEKLHESIVLGNEEAALNGSELFRSRFKKDSRSGARIRRSTVKAWEKKTGKKADIKNLAIDEKV